jgi:hypothetical protein
LVVGRWSLVVGHLPLSLIDPTTHHDYRPMTNDQ